jgi:uncharacterized membrane protein
MLNIHLLIALLWLAAASVWLSGTNNGVTIAIGVTCIAMAVIKFLRAVRQGRHQQETSDE